MSLKLLPLNAKDPAHLSALQRVLEEAPTYSLNVSGAPQPPEAAREAFEALPEGFPATNKFVLGIFQSHQMIGCADILRGFPESTTAMIGLLLLSEKHQGKGLGAESFRAAESLIRTWPEIRKIRIAVVLTNAQVLDFWKRCGFQETGNRRPYENGIVKSESVILEKMIG